MMGVILCEVVVQANVQIRTAKAAERQAAAAAKAGVAAQLVPDMTRSVTARRSRQLVVLGSSGDKCAITDAQKKEAAASSRAAFVPVSK